MTPISLELNQMRRLTSCLMRNHRRHLMPSDCAPAWATTSKYRAFGHLRSCARHHRAYVRQADDLIPTEARGKWDLREMRIISMMCPALILAGCTFLNDAPPKVIYQSSDTISVEFSDDGLLRVSNRQEAMEMIERHCGGPYRIVGGSGGRIDAECVR